MASTSFSTEGGKTLDANITQDADIYARITETTEAFHTIKNKFITKK